MEFVSIPLIVIVCYLVAEVYKFVLRKKTEYYKLIPVIVTFVGGLLGLLIYFTYPKVMLGADNLIIAITIGLVSGASSTGANQIIKQLFKINKIINQI